MTKQGKTFHVKRISDSLKINEGGKLSDSIKICLSTANCRHIKCCLQSCKSAWTYNKPIIDSFIRN